MCWLTKHTLETRLSKAKNACVPWSMYTTHISSRESYYQQMDNIQKGKTKEHGECKNNNRVEQETREQVFGRGVIDTRVCVCVYHYRKTFLFFLLSADWQATRIERKKKNGTCAHINTSILSLYSIYIYIYISCEMSHTTCMFFKSSADVSKYRRCAHFVPELNTQLIVE